MAKYGYILAVVFLLAISITNVNAILKCWRCSSDTTNGAFCADPFDPEIINEQQKYWSYVNCSYVYGVKSASSRPVCKKLVQEIYGKRVVSRSCFYEDIDDPADKCVYENYPSYIRTLYCNTCTTDGCNSATGLAPYAVLILLSMALAKLLIL